MNILEKKNIILNCSLTNKEDVIRHIGNIFYKDGYTTEAYTQAMLDKEKVFNTAIGNSVAIPHGIEDGKKEVRSSGLVIMTFPNGIDWNGTTVTLVIGIAGAGDEHVEILSNIAVACSDEDDVTAIVHSTADEIYTQFATID
ncbi:MAG: PTS sugar transporter subunit IIA [Megasphaera sp.]|jgi:mannitol/fructose-specific phosphotransferase system IIA component|nr:PTS sugar transporter subunit IIA [Megasphaera sp.]MCH4188350.1 PTS sugar transporter subunit IIA [Megasphaera sp.]MCH4218143.1 PTS sugar transporter subunit IIA [Megasphaera sp.]